ncbi:MAG: hypothetical protein MJ237_06710 [bacterium]|nr:hypothetical protein [bacterium]
MGLSATQARLLTITARQHDVEYQAQAIQNAKLVLATQSDDAYKEYLEALESTTLTISAFDAVNGSSLVTGTFNNIFSSNRVTPSNGTSYVLRNKYGAAVVEDDVAEKYYAFRENSSMPKTAYGFAVYMLLNGQDAAAYGTIMNGLADANDPQLQNLHDQIFALVDVHSPISTIYSIGNSIPEDKREQYQALLRAYEAQAFNRHSDAIAAGCGIDNFDRSQFDYYVQIYNAIQCCGGECVPISDFNGVVGVGDASNNEEWLRTMLQCGQLSISQLHYNNNTYEYTMNAVDISADSGLAYTTTTQIDKTALARAEAEYEHKMKLIDRKDKKFDMDLAKLDTERNALKTQFESLKKVCEANVERTFGIFS